MGLRRGDKLGKFTVLEDLGHGGMGGVFGGVDETGNKIAVKTLDTRYLPDPTFVPRFVREAEAYRKMSHPNIVRYVGSGVQEGLYYIVLERCAGTTLEAVLKDQRGPLPLARALGLAIQLFQALEHAHGLKIIHRDIKPKNVMIDTEDRLKLIDFGIAAADDNLLQTGVGAILGSYAYASPEQNQGQQVDERTDLYSAGLIVWEMLTGQQALKDKTLLDVTRTQMTRGVPPPSAWNKKLPAAVDPILAKLLAKNRTERFATATEARQAIESLLPGAG